MIVATNREWLDEHLETFVRPNLGSIPDINRTRMADKGWTEKRISALHAIWTQCKRLAEGRPILLPGRDVWLLEVLARMEGFPTTFRKDISSCVAKSGLLKEDFSHFHAFDTGYSGSVPKALKCEHWHLMTWSGMGPKPEDPKIKNKTQKRLEQYRSLEAHMIFPYVQRGKYNNSGIYISSPSPLVHIAGALEGSMKYWQRAEVRYAPRVSNEPSKAIALEPQMIEPNPEYFKNAAIITRLIAESCLVR